MYLCYLDESGTSDIPGNTSHFVLAGIAIPIWFWKRCEDDIIRLKRKFELEHAEIHAGWLIRPYAEERKIPNFLNLDRSRRRFEMSKIRNQEILRLQRRQNRAALKQLKKNYRNTEHYLHLTYAERVQFIREICDTIGSWGFARLFAECIDKLYFNPTMARRTIDEQAFEQIVSRFEIFLKNIGRDERQYGLLIHDNNETVARGHTALMKKFQSDGTLWTEVENVIEAPLFVDSQLTSMVQIADVCSYSLRRYLENSEADLFTRIFSRADKRGETVVGVRHFTKSDCTCAICAAHRT